MEDEYSTMPTAITVMTTKSTMTMDVLAEKKTQREGRKLRKKRRGEEQI